MNGNILKMQAVALTGIVLACTTRPPPEYPEPSSERAWTPPVPEPAAPAPPTLAEVARACAAVQQASDIPVGCKIGYQEGSPTMLITVASAEIAQALLPAIAEHVAGPFCEATSRANRRAAVYLLYGQPTAYRVECETGEGQEVELHRPPTPEDYLQAALEACMAIRASNEPVDCTMAEVSGRPSVLLQFRSREEAEGLGQSLAQLVGAPFCEAANYAGANGALFEVVSERQARGIDCRQGVWTNWRNIRRARAPNPSPPPHQPSQATPRPGEGTLAARQASYPRYYELY